MEGPKPTKAQIVQLLRKWINQRPGLDLREYGGYSGYDFYKDGTIASESWHIRDGVTRVISYHENGSVKEDLSYHAGDDEDFIVNNSLFYNKNY